MTTPGTESPTTRRRALRPLRSREYRLLVAALALSIFATGAWTIVMVLQVLAIDNSPVALSGVAACLSAGLFVFALVGGIAADRFSRRKILIVVQVVNTVVVGLVALLSLTDTIALWHLAIASAAIGSGSAFFYPAHTAYLPQVLPGEELLAANGLEGALRPTMQQALGPAVGGLVVGAFLPAGGAILVAVAFGGALVLTLFLAPLPAVATADTADLGDAEPKSGFFRDLAAGVGFVVRTRWLLWTLLFASLLALITMGPIEVLLPFTAKNVFEDGGRMPLSIALVGPLSSVVPIPVLFLAAGVLPVLVAIVAITAGGMPRDELSHPLDVPADDAPADVPADDREVRR